MSQAASNPIHTASQPKSDALYERACRVIPGGVNSPVRAFRAVGGTPLFIARGAGAQHLRCRRPRVPGLRGLLGTADRWATRTRRWWRRSPRRWLAARPSARPVPAEVELAERVVASYPAAEQVRFVSSGTEAVMSAIRVARAFTGRDLIVKFAGCYHGHADHLLVAAGSGLATFGTASSAGVPAGFHRLHARAAAG